MRETDGARGRRTGNISRKVPRMAYSSRLGFREIAAQLREEIVQGVYPYGTVFPAEQVFADRYGTTRSMINRVIRLLAAEGLIYPKQGRGTIITYLPPILHSPARYAQKTREGGGAVGSFDADVRAAGLEPRHEITTCPAAPPAEIADVLGLVHGEKNALVRRRRLFISGVPARLSASWFPLSIAQGTDLEREVPVFGGVKSTLAALGYRQVEASERFATRFPDEDEAEMLGVSLERTVIDVFHVGRTQEGRAVEVTVSVTPAHLMVIESAFLLD